VISAGGVKTGYKRYYFVAEKQREAVELRVRGEIMRIDWLLMRTLYL
jgi:hypothetical protein